MAIYAGKFRIRASICPLRVDLFKCFAAPLREDEVVFSFRHQASVHRGLKIPCDIFVTSLATFRANDERCSRRAV